LLHGISDELEASSFGPIRLRNHKRHLESSLDQSVERGYRKTRRTAKDKLQGSNHSTG
jgi:hypothetical protein